MARRSWSMQDAKNPFSEVVEAARRRPQTITKHGKPAVVVVDVAEYERLRRLERARAPFLCRCDTSPCRRTMANSRVLMCGCAILISDVPDRYRYAIRIAQAVARSDGRGVVRTAAHGRSFPQRHQHWRNRARHCATAHDGPGFCGRACGLAGSGADALRRAGRVIRPANSAALGRVERALGNDGADLMIAATALENGLTVLTRNVSDFELTGVAVLDPFSRRPIRKS
jgi:prevent-host-death family protein